MSTALAEIQKLVDETKARPVEELEDDLRRMAALGQAHLMPLLVENALESGDPELVRKSVDTLNKVATSYKPKDKVETLATLNVQFIGGSFVADITPPPEVIDAEEVQEPTADPQKALQAPEPPTVLSDDISGLERALDEVERVAAKREAEAQGADPTDDPSFVDELNRMLGFD